MISVLFFIVTSCQFLSSPEAVEVEVEITKDIIEKIAEEILEEDF